MMLRMADGWQMGMDGQTEGRTDGGLCVHMHRRPHAARQSGVGAHGFIYRGCGGRKGEGHVETPINSFNFFHTS